MKVEKALLQDAAERAGSPGQRADALEPTRLLVAKEETPMRFYTGQYRFADGSAPHARWLYACILTATGEVNVAITADGTSPSRSGIVLSHDHRRP